MSKNAHRTTLYLDDEAKRIEETHDVNRSEEYRRYLKQKYGSISMLEDRLKELESKDDRLLSEKQRIERERQQIKKDLRVLNNLLVKNDVMQQIKSNDAWRVKVEKKIGVLKTAKEQHGDSREEMQVAVEKNARILSEELPFDQEKLADILRESIKV